MNKKLSRSILSICVLLSIKHITCANYCCDKNYAFSKTHFSQRPQGNNQALVFVGNSYKTHLIDNDENYLNITIALGYKQNFNRYDLGRYFFTERGPLNIGMANSDVDIQNLQLGLASNFKGTACLLPQIHELNADIDVFIGLDKWFQGVWGRLRLPFVNTNWNPCLNTSNNETGTSVYPDGFASNAGNIVNVEYRTLEDALCDGSRIGMIPEAEGGKICCNNKRYGLSDIHLELGYDFLRGEHGNLGIALVGAIPTGQPNFKKGNHDLFTPSIGSQMSGQIGVALRGQYEIFNSAPSNKAVTIYSDLRTIYLMPGCNRRLFSLWANGTTAFNSWLMLNRYNSQGTFIGTERAVNVLNQKVKVSATMLEWTLMGQMRKDNWDISLGYNFWYRSQETLCPTNKVLGNGSDYYAIKYTNTDFTTNPPTVTSDWGTHFLSKITHDIANQSTKTQAGETPSYLLPTVENLKNFGIRAGDIDVCAAQHPATYSNMFFGYVGYNFSQTWLKPFFGFSGQLEMGRGNTALSTWALYLKGGISF